MKEKLINGLIKVGDTLEVDDKTFICKENIIGDACDKCDFYCVPECERMICSHIGRLDKKDVYFSLVYKELMLNPDAKLVEGIKKGTEKKNGHCPCLIFKNEETLCPFYAQDEYPKEVSINEVCIYSQKNVDVAKDGCHCTLYVPKKSKVDKIIGKTFFLNQSELKEQMTKLYAEIKEFSHIPHSIEVFDKDFCHLIITFSPETEIENMVLKNRLQNKLKNEDTCFAEVE